MKLHPDSLPALNTVTAYDKTYIEVNGQRHQTHLHLMPDGAVQAWQIAGFDSIGPDDLQAMLARSPELILIGTGMRQRFLHPRVTAPLAQARIGFELMSTPAACRTYNILMGEGRRPLLALLLE